MKVSVFCLTSWLNEKVEGAKKFLMTCRFITIKSLNENIV